VNELGGTFLELSFYGNTVRAWLYALLVLLAVFFALGLLKSVLIRQFGRLSKVTGTPWDDVLLKILAVTRSWLMVALALWAAALVLELPSRTLDIIVTVAVLAILAQLGIWGTTAISSYVKLYGQKNLEEDAASVMTVRALGFLGSVALWTIIFLVVLDNLGIDVTALIAGLGIGGVAVALALQNVLGDLFASLSIVLDKPFVVGDFIIVGDSLGTVEHVGLKTTRLRSLSGEQLVFANSDLLKSRIRNFKRMHERRVVFSFGVEYGTPQELLEWIPGAVREIVEGLPDTRFDRAHFKEYGDSSLNFEVVYYVLQPDFNLYMDRQQAINLELYRLFEERDVAFAFPTRTLHLVPAELAPAK
jgi:small-conductance mechanosensitive channel